MPYIHKYNWCDFGGNEIVSVKSRPSDIFNRLFLDGCHALYFRLGAIRYSCRHHKKIIRKYCKVVCSPRAFATVTTLLTDYALFGDDMRLILSVKSVDPFFDVSTILATVSFIIELIAFIGGKWRFHGAFGDSPLARWLGGWCAGGWCVGLASVGLVGLWFEHGGV